MRHIQLAFVPLFTLLFMNIVAPSASAEVTLVTETVVTTAVHDRAAIEKQVREYFADIPVMIEIARCESNFRQFTDGGSVLRSAGMIGIFQFHEVVHSGAALTLGHDLATTAGNLAYARHLYEQAGTGPWSSCVPQVIPPPSTNEVIPLASTNDDITELKIQLMTQLIGLLQELLKLKLASQ